MDILAGSSGAVLIISFFTIDENENATPLDISQASKLQLNVTRQNGSKETWDCTKYSDTQMSVTIPKIDVATEETIHLVPYVEWSADLNFPGTALILRVRTP